MRDADTESAWMRYGDAALHAQRSTAMDADTRAHRTAPAHDRGQSPRLSFADTLRRLHAFVGTRVSIDVLAVGDTRLVATMEGMLTAVVDVSDESRSADYTGMLVLNESAQLATLIHERNFLGAWATGDGAVMLVDLGDVDVIVGSLRGQAPVRNVRRI